MRSLPTRTLVLIVLAVLALGYGAWTYFGGSSDSGSDAPTAPVALADTRLGVPGGNLLMPYVQRPNAARARAQVMPALARVDDAQRKVNAVISTDTISEVLADEGKRAAAMKVLPYYSQSWAQAKRAAAGTPLRAPAAAGEKAALSVTALFRAAGRSGAESQAVATRLEQMKTSFGRFGQAMGKLQMSNR